MCFPNYFTNVLRTSTLQNADRLLPLKYLLKIKIAASDKFFRSSRSEMFFKIDGLMVHEYMMVLKFFYRTPLVPASKFLVLLGKF